MSSVDLSLRELQQQVQARLRRTRPPEADRLPLNPQRGTPGAVRLDVYATGYDARILAALQETYPAIRRVLGEPVFASMAASYAARHPSRDYNLSLAGRHLPDFLTTSPLAPRLPFLPDLARLEWAITRAFHAFEQPPAPLEELARVSPEAWAHLRLEFQPSVSVIESAWPMVEIWEARTAPPASINIRVENRPQQALIYRQGLQVRCDLVEPDAFRLLDALLRGSALGAACEQVAASDPHLDAQRFQQHCAQWARAGLIVSWRVDTGGSP